jgi:hypothetical protein
MTSPTLLDLAAIVEKLTGPCRETDAEIWMTLHPDWRNYPRNEMGGWDCPTGRTRAAEPYTASLDTAMTLVPEGHGFYFRRNCSADGEVVYCNAQVWPFSDPRDDEAPHYWANSPEDAPAIALVAACLKARAALEASHG